LSVTEAPSPTPTPQVFKNAIRVPTIARSVCSNDETIGLGVSTASVDGVNPGQQAWGCREVTVGNKRQSEGCLKHSRKTQQCRYHRELNEKAHQGKALGDEMHISRGTVKSLAGLGAAVAGVLI
jgi:hypothetical protein